MTSQKLMGVVEADETFIGGKNRNRHWDKKTPWKVGGITSGKIGVIGAISRKGYVVCQVIGDTSAETLTGCVRKVTSDKVELVATDDATGYEPVELYRPHATVRHSDGEYVRGEVHTQNLE